MAWPWIGRSCSKKLLEEVARGCSKRLLAYTLGKEVAQSRGALRKLLVYRMPESGPEGVVSPGTIEKSRKMCRGGVDIDPSKRGGGSAGFQKFPLVKTVRGQNFLSTRSLLKLSRPMTQARRDLSESTLISDSEEIWRRDPLDPV